MTIHRPFICLMTALLIGVGGCRSGRKEFHFSEHQVGPYQDYATEIDYPDVATAMAPELAASGRPRAIQNPSELEPWDMKLPDAVRLGMTNSNVIRNLGGSVVSAPASTQTMFDPALIESDPRSSVEAALSAFDTQLSSSIFWNKIDRGINQTFSGLFLPVLQQMQSAYVTELAKTTATGARFTLRNHINYDRTEIENPSLRFTSVYDLDYEAEYRQPLLQGAGVEFNRIAGPNSTVGAPNGVLLARINTDVSLADFEAAVTQLVSDVEDAYWDLYFAYRDLEAMVKGRDSALVTWRNVAHRLRIAVPGGTLEDEALLRSQYFTFQAAVEDSLSTLYSREERLRYLLGLPPNGPQLIRPASEPFEAKVVFDWHDSLGEAFVRRVELRRQKWQIKRRELELTAARNYIKPRLDAVALYRWRGIGDKLIASPGPTGFESAFQNLTTGKYQEWQLGVQLNIPIGFRREFTALRNAELRLARERALLKEQEFRISHDMSQAMRSLERAFQLMKTNLNRRAAAHNEVRVLQERKKEGFVQLDVVLQAEKRRADADSAYYRVLVDYALAIKNVHRAKGTLLPYDGVSLAEGPWSTKAYRDALDRSRHFAPRLIDYGIHRRHPISQGPYDQHPPLTQPMDANVPAEQVDTPHGQNGSTELPLPPPGDVRKRE